VKAVTSLASAGDASGDSVDSVLSSALREAGTPTTSPERIQQLHTHHDVRVRVLCARHPQLTAVARLELARDPAEPVRAAVASRPRLDTLTIDALLATGGRRVRNILIAHQQLSALQLATILTAGNSSNARQQLDVLLKDSANTRRVLGSPRLGWFAVRGSLDHNDLRDFLKAPAPHLVGAVLRNATLTRRSVRWLARHGEPSWFAIVAARPDIPSRTIDPAVLMGRSSAAAVVVERGWSRRSVRAVARLRRGREVLRARARLETLPWRLRLLARSRHWDVRVAAAMNPATPVRSFRRRRAEQPIALDVALAGRPDLDARSVSTLRYSWQVDLALAANDRVPPAGAERAANSRDVFSRVWSLGNPQVPITRVMEVAATDQPAWVLRRITQHPALPETERDRILTWLALGGAAGDPRFDPVQCSGSPAAAGETADSAYRREMGRDGLRSSLWRVRAMVGAGAGKLDHRVIHDLAHDIRPEVRAVAARYTHVPTLRALQRDGSPMVAATASRVWSTIPGSTRHRERFGSQRVPLRFVGAVVAGLVGLGLAQAGNSSSPNTSGRDQLLYGAQGFAVLSQQGSSGVQLFGVGTPMSTDRTPVCDTLDFTLGVQDQGSTIAVVVTAGAHLTSVEVRAREGDDSDTRTLAVTPNAAVAIQARRTVRLIVVVTGPQALTGVTFFDRGWTIGSGGAAC
jgi:hypothetical protein